MCVCGTSRHKCPIVCQKVEVRNPRWFNPTTCGPIAGRNTQNGVSSWIEQPWIPKRDQGLSTGKRAARLAKRTLTGADPEHRSASPPRNQQLSICAERLPLTHNITSHSLSKGTSSKNSPKCISVNTGILCVTVEQMHCGIQPNHLLEHSRAQCIQLQHGMVFSKHTVQLLKSNILFLNHWCTPCNH